MKAYPRKTLKSKLLQITLSIMLVTVVATIISLAWSSRQAEQERLKETSELIHGSIASRAATLTRGHALALRGLVIDNAYGDVRQLIRGAVQDDGDILYGVFVGSDDRPWAYESPGKEAHIDDDNVVPILPAELGLAKQAQRQDTQSLQEDKRVFGQEVYEVSSAVTDERGEFLGRVVYGFSKERTRRMLEEARNRSQSAQRTAILTTVLTGLSTLLIGVFWVVRSSAHITRPLRDLTAAANRIAAGQRGVRVSASSEDEVEVLAAAFNQMQHSNEEAMRKLEVAKEKALAAERLKGEFLANMSHEIRTPMNGVLGMTRLMRGEELSPKLRRYVDSIDASANALVTVINDILDFSKLESGRYTLENQPFDVHAVVQEVAELLASQSHHKDLEVMYRLGPEVPNFVIGDSDRLRQILTNLVGNAVKFTESGEVIIDVTAARLDETCLELRVSVADTGVGISADHIPRLWEKFSQVDGSAVRRHGGTGLGLAISKRLVEMMGGKVRVESEPGRGSTFSFHVRLAVDARSEQHSILDERADLRVLMVHPSARWRQIAEERARAWGVAVHSKDSGEAALEVLRSASETAPWEVVVARHDLGDMQLAEFVVRVREELGLDVPIIAVAKPGSEAVPAEIASELRAQLDAPVRPAELFAALTGQLADASARRLSMPIEAVSHGRPLNPILVVDDNKINRLVVLEDLQRLGYSTDAAQDGGEAVDRFKSGNYSCVLMDCQMPIMDGYEATRLIRQYERDNGLAPTPIIALTAHAFEGERERVLAAGMDDFLSKPFRHSSLHRLLRQYGTVSDAASLPALDQLVATTTDTAELVDLDQNVARSELLLRLFLDQMPSQLDDLEEAVAAGNTKSIRTGAHKLKGSCMTLAAPRMAATAALVQQRADAGQLDQIPILIVELRRHHQRVRELVMQELRSVSARSQDDDAVGSWGGSEP